MNILFADSIADDRLDPLRDAGHTVRVEPGLTADDLPRQLAGIDVLVVRSTKVTDASIGAADRLSLIVRAGAGTDNIDLAAASAAGVYVCNVPGRNAVAVAELTLGLLLAADRRIADGVADLRAGRWDKAGYSKADGLYGKTMAIIGLGEIGLAVAERAKAFGIIVAAQRREGRTAEVQARIRSIGIRLVDDRRDLLTDADIVSIHVPKGAETTGMVDRDFLDQLRPGAVLLNTARGEVIDGAALLERLDRGDLVAGLDVWPDEPSSSVGAFTSPLAEHPRVVGSHHIGASTAQAQRSVADGTVEVVQAYLRGEVVNCVNLNRTPAGTHRLTVRHLDRVGVLAQIFALLRSRGLNVQQMENRLFTGGQAAVATINVAGETDEAATDELLLALREIDEVLDAGLTSVSTR